MSPIATEALLGAALEWIMRLPLLGEAELALLLGIPAPDAAAAQLELDRRGYVEWIAPAVSGLDPQRRAMVLRPGAVADLATNSGLPVADFAKRTAVRRIDVLRRIPAVAQVTAINRTFALLAAALRARGEAALIDACSLPPGSGRRWWPQTVNAYGAVRMGTRIARFFLVWDRAGAPDADRRGRVGAWLSHARTSDVILVVCAGERELGIWRTAIRQHVGAVLPSVRLTTADEILEVGPRAAIWSHDGSPKRETFEQAVSWQEATDGSPLLALPAATPLVARRDTSLRFRDWASTAALRADGASISESVAALALVTDAGEKQCLEWLARHPRLSAAQLAGFVDLPVAAVVRRLDRLARWYAVRRLSADRDAPDIWVIAVRGLRLVAAEEGTTLGRLAPPRTAVRLMAEGAPDRRSVPHELGVVRMVAALEADARAAGAQLDAWRNEAESAHYFEHDGRPCWIRPDGAAVLVTGGAKTPLLLEFDRGTLDGGDFARKFAAYQRYYAANLWRVRFSRAPLLLFVCSDPPAERRISDALVRIDACDLPILLTAEWRVRRSPEGFMGQIWARPGSMETRHGLECVAGSGAEHGK